MSWDWRDVYPGKRVITLIIDPDQAALLSELRGVRAVAADVYKIDDDAEIAIRGGPPDRPSKAMPDRSTTAPDPAPEPVSKPKPEPKPEPMPRPAPKAASKPRKRTVKPPRTAPITSTARTAAKQPETVRATREPERPPSSITKQDIAMVEEAIASGQVKVTKCPPMTFTPEEEVRGSWGWRGGKGQTARRVAAKRKIARQKAAVQQEAEGA